MKEANVKARDARKYAAMYVRVEDEEDEEDGGCTSACVCLHRTSEHKVMKGCPHSN